MNLSHIRIFQCLPRFLAWAGVLSIFASAANAAEPPAATKRATWTASRMVGTPDPPPPYRVELAFPQLKFDRPLDISSAPGSDRLFVVEHSGKIHSFVNRPGCDKFDLLADLKQAIPSLSALYALTFHPDFARNRYAYVCYVEGGAESPDGSHIARFTVTATDPPTLDPASEHTVLRWRSGGHNGCCLKFGPDGCLYISTGDGSGPNPPDGLQAGQDVSNLLSAILRIDVDHAEGGQNYRVPADNPFVGLAEARPEIWAYGFRNPWRMSFDRVKGDLWVGDVGWQLWEMIYRVERGGNYGWSVMEGPQPALPEAKRGPTPVLPPTVSHPHSEAASITGGFVYHGTRLPELEGAYIYGDFQTGKIWGLRHDGQQVTWHQELAQTPMSLVAFAEDQSGELFLLDYERSQQVFRLVKNDEDNQQAAFPRRLSQTGIFASVADQTPSPGVIPYSINAAHWADHTTSQRWMAVPGNKPIAIEGIGASRYPAGSLPALAQAAAGISAGNESWRFPEGSVLVKTVSLEMERGLPASRRRLETQVLHRLNGAWRPYTYAWNEEQTDADLVEATGGSRQLNIRDGQSPDLFHEQTYRLASRAECKLCHNPWVETKTTNYGVQTASPLAVSTPQLNRPGEADGSSENQLAAWQRMGLLAGFMPAKLDDAPKLADPYDLAADLNHRVRSYLQVNCSHCHQPHGGGAAMIDLGFFPKLEDTKTLDVRPAQGAFGIANARIISPADPLGSVLHYRMSKVGGGRMPRLGSDEVDQQAVAMIHDWIGQLPPPKTASARPPQEEDAAWLAALRGEASAVRTEAIRKLAASTRGALALLRSVDRGELLPEARAEAIAITAEHPQAEVRDLFERFLPPAQRLKRLGNVVDPAAVLALAADAERGKQLFFREGAATCKSCHRVSGKGETLGPDLTQIGKKYQPKDLLTHLFEPSKFIEPKFVSYLLETTDGQVLTGLLVERNDREVVLKNAQNKEVRVPAGEVESLVTQPKSLMPELLLRDLTPQQAADLLAFLTSLK